MRKGNLKTVKQKLITTTIKEREQQELSWKKTQKTNNSKLSEINWLKTNLKNQWLLNKYKTKRTNQQFNNKKKKQNLM